MPQDDTTQKSTPLLYRKIPNRVLEIIIVACLLSFLLVVFIPPFTTPRGPEMAILDMSNLRQILSATVAYAIDEQGELPPHIGTIPGYYDTVECFISPFDKRELISLTVEHPSPNVWYRFGSYWFYPSAGLNLDTTEHHDRFIYAYREPRPDSDFYIAGFLDGSVQRLDETEFHEIKKRQDMSFNKDTSYTDDVKPKQ